ncbi:MAG: nucleoid occlusion factor SlmA [Thalassolituus sp.]|jgi:TetR/AcrR family transcriptional regulator|tara:strand:+ start:232 stop:846 length:615 start_codon:yes stop_codon:yes gene_type:complete
MTESAEKMSRRDQILQSLAHMLETDPGARITTAKLASAVGVSEAALYRHFPSKAKMFEGLIAFIEETLFSRITLILKDINSASERCEKTMGLILGFAEKNPGMCRLLSGDALAGETDRLRQRIHQVFDRIELQFKQILREAEVREGLLPQRSAAASANLLTAVLEGRIRQYVRTEFATKPTEYWDQQWAGLKLILLQEKSLAMP